MDKASIIYYTDNKIKDPIKSLVREYLLKAGIPITSSSLEPIDFGDNEVVEGVRSYPTMVKQIISCLERAKGDYVFFCEHDVLYPREHFDFIPYRDDMFFYDEACWRWWIGSPTAIRHDRMLSLSSMCANRDYILRHYKKRQKLIDDNGWGDDVVGEPQWARRMGYEPGQKQKRRGGYFDDDFLTWEAELPMIDIRHRRTFSMPKNKISQFKHKPKWWEEIPIERIKGWDLKELFDEHTNKR